jgi:hypothetical protein
MEIDTLIVFQKFKNRNMNKVKNGNEECMCIGCVNKLMEKVIGYLEFKNEELNDMIGYIIKESNDENKTVLNLRRESVDVEEMIKDLIEFHEYNDELLKQTVSK